MLRRTLLTAAALAPVAVRAQPTTPWAPTRPMRLMVSYPPGGGTDIVARLMARALSDQLGQPIAVENRPGASEMVGTEALVRAAPDGHTIGLVTNTVTINPGLYPNMPYDAARDIRMLSTLCMVPLALVVHPSVPATNMAELIALAKARPDAMSYASLGPGSGHGLSMEWLKHLSGTRIVGVTYRGVAAATQAISTNEVQMGFAGLVSSLPQIRAGRLRVIGVSPVEGVPGYSEFPPIGATVTGYDSTTWYGLGTQAAVPAPAFARLHEETIRALNSEEIRARFANVGVEPAPESAEATARRVAEETAKWTRVIQLTGIKPE